MPDETPQQSPQDADCDGPAHECVIVHVVDAATHGLAELLSPPRLTKHSFVLFGFRPGQAFDLVDGIDLCTLPGRALVWAYLQSTPP